MGVPDEKNVCRLLLLFLILFAVPIPNWNSIVQAQPIRPVTNTAPASSDLLSSFTLNEWNVPTVGAGPWGITTDRLGKIWFTENVTNKLARYDPTNNNFTEWSIPGGGNPRYVTTTQVVIGNSNVTRVYFTEYSSNRIAYFNSWNGTFYEWQLAAGSNPAGIFVDSNNTIWFTESGRDVIGRISPTTNQLTEWTLPGATGTPGTPALEPWGIYVKSGLTGLYANITERFVWLTELAKNAIVRLQVTNNLLITWDLNSLTVIPGLKYGPMDITIDSTTPGNVIFTASTGDRISILQNCGTTCTGYIEYAFPSRTSLAKPTSVSLDPTRSVYWLTEYNTGIVAGLDTTSQGNPSVVPSSSACVFPPTAGPACASPSGYTTNTATPIVTNNVHGSSSYGVLQPPAAVSIFQGPINGITEYKLPTVTARPNFVTVDSIGNIWFTENNVTINRIGRLSIPYAFTLSVSPTTQAVNPGQSATYSVSVGVTSGNSVPVQLTVNNPQNTVATFNPQVGTPPFTSVLIISTSNSTVPVTYTVSVTATSNGVSQTSQVMLTVNSPPPPPSFDFQINTIGGPVTVQQGQLATFQFRTSPITNAPTQSVNLTVNQAGLPAGTTVSQFINTYGNPPFNSTLVLQTSVNTPGGSYSITNLVTGVSKGGTPHHPIQAALLVVTEIPRDFNLTASSYAVNVVQASKIDITVAVTSIGPFSGNVSLNGSFPSSVHGLSVTFSPSTLSPLPNGGTAQATMEIVATINTPGQVYQLTVSGISNTPLRSHQITIQVRVSPCLIATATFGSELAPQVQFLRDFRDQQVLSTFAGFNFMYVFNSWYYSFSPAVAQYESSHSTMRSILSISLYPLIGILQLASLSFSSLVFQPEVGILAAGMLASSLIGLVYFALPVSGLCFLCRLDSRRKRKMLKSLVPVILSLMGAYCLAEVFTLATLMMVASAGIVLTFLLAGSVSLMGLVEFARRR